jgi:hypothetical protein
VVLGGRLPTPGLFSRVSHFRLAGHDVAFVVNHDGAFGSPAEIRVINLRTRHTVSHHDAVVKAGARREDQVGSLVVSRSAATAWIVRSTTPGPSPSRALRQVDIAAPRSAARTVDSGPSIAPWSLRLHGCRVVWRDGGHRRTAPLSGCA